MDGMYLVDYYSPMVGLADFILNTTTPPTPPHEEVLLYYGSWGWKPLRISTDKTDVKVGEQFTITVEYFNDTVSVWNPVEDAIVHVGNLNYATNENGEVTISLTAQGDYTATIYAEKSGYIRSEKTDIHIYHYCGDGYCDSGEGCSSCPQDCGVCITGGIIRIPTETIFSHFWDEITPNESASITIEKEGIELTKIQIKVKNRVNNVEIRIKKLKDKPEGVTKAMGKVYQYVEITSKNIGENIERINIDFKVNRTWIKNNNIDPSTIALNRYSDNKWERLSTTLTNETKDYIYYSAESPGFSVFAISGEILKLCETGAKRCFESDLQQCDPEGDWITIEICDYGCNPETLSCESETFEKICSPGEKKCLNNNLQQCSSDGSEWLTIRSCDYGCEHSKCLEKLSVSLPTGEMIARPVIIGGMVLIIILCGLIYWKARRF
jgi:PGF-pre-PGF domain-containing protein